MPARQWAVSGTWMFYFSPQPIAPYPARLVFHFRIRVEAHRIEEHLNWLV